MGKATREAYGQALVDIGARYESIVVLDADLSKSTNTAQFKQAYPDRFFNAGIAEQNLVAVGAGLAAAGKKPFLSTFAMFAAGRAYEQVRNSVCYPKLPVTLCATHAGLTVGEDGASHQCVEDISLMRTIPNMTVIVPADEVETRSVIAWAAEYNGPAYIRLGRSSVDVTTPSDYTFQLGRALTLREGHDITLIACGIMVPIVLEAASLLADKHIEARVLNMASIKPIDREAIIAAARETGGIVTAEEHSIYGGLGSAVAEIVAATHPVRVRAVGVQDTFGESGTPKELLAKYGLTAQDVVQAALEVLGR